ncbi:MAG: hypothetical protein HZB91_12035 [Elusimicrobia bacterium]|nr:hypothetical protein [Elusimicrobiota bacterium]
MKRPDPAPSSRLPRRIADLLSRDLVHEAVREYQALLRKEPDRPALRVEFAELLAGRGWTEEALRHLRQALSPAEGDDLLIERCVADLESLPLPAAKTLAAKVRAESAERRRRGQRRYRLRLLAAAALALAVVAALVRDRADSAGGSGPEKICREFPKGSPAAELPERARELRIFRLVLKDQAGRPVLDKPLSELAPEDWDAVQERLAGLKGSVVFTNPPSISVNRWCVIDFAGGRVDRSVALSNAP